MSNQFGQSAHLQIGFSIYLDDVQYGHEIDITTLLFSNILCNWRITER